MCFKLPEKYQVIFNSEEKQASESSHAAMIVQMPSPFPFASTQVVPWKYEPTIEEDGTVMPMPEAAAAVKNITGPSRLTRGGRIFEVVPPLVVNPQPTPPVVLASPYVSSREVIDHDNAAEFLKLIKKSDYRVVDQLHQTPLKISILSSLINTCCARYNREPIRWYCQQYHVLRKSEFY